MEQNRENLFVGVSVATSSSNYKIISSQADLDPKTHVMPEMLEWCRRQENIVVLQNGNILSNNVLSRVVQNCKIVMINKGLMPGSIYPATIELIKILLDNAQAQSTHSIETTVSTQQQRLRTLVKDAIEMNASDIHIEVRNHIARIRFRKHGELFLYAEWAPKLAKEVANVAFNKETDHSVTHFNPLIPQNASMPLVIDGREMRLRLASLPAHEGYDVVMRILSVGDEKILSLQTLGYTPDQISMIKKALRMPAGAILLAGPTGSGKTTTLASALQLVTADRKIFTIEDPVEKLIQSATQIPVNTEHEDRSFANLARTILRMDPDVIVLGELRDEDTAKVMTRAAITGHLVFTTVHTNSAIGIVTRLMDLGISTSLLANPNFLVCLMCQRLVPLLCTDCSKPLTDSREHRYIAYRWQKVLSDTSHLRLRSQCEKCQGLGIRGRTVVAEMIWMDEGACQFIKDGNLLGWKEHLKNSGWFSYYDHLLGLVSTGQCDPIDAEKMIGDLNKLLN